MAEKLKKLIPKKQVKKSAAVGGKSGAAKKSAKEKETTEAKSHSQLTLEQVVKAVDEKNGLISLVARHLGVTPQAIYKWRDNYEEVREALENARNRTIDVAENSLLGAILKGEPWAVCFTLKTLGKSRGYVERIEQTGKDGGAIKTDNKLTIEIIDSADESQDQ